MTRLTVLLLFGMVLLPTAWSQQPAVPNDAEVAADRAYTARRWPEAETSYQQLTAAKPAKANFWYRLGIAARANKHYNLSLDALENAKTLGVPNGLPVSLADYEIATTYAAKGELAKAFTALKASADAGFSQTNRIDSDEDWNTLRSRVEFLALAKQVHHNAAPCDDPEFRQFDFWLGDWDVSSAPNGLPAGTSHISREMSGCVVWENWTSAGSPYFGKSYNTYNVGLKRWEQYWVDNAAGNIFFYGNLKDNTMDYWADDVPQPTGGMLRRHLQFTPLGPDKVRQFSQGSTDGGKTWQVQYDLIYTRHTSSPAKPN
jgi:tetratricopeptide (TPR) repeat protein